MRNYANDLVLSPERKKIGQILKDARESRGLTFQQVAAHLGCSTTALVMESENGSKVPFKYIAKILKLYKVSPEQVLELILASQERILRSELKSNG